MPQLIKNRMRRGQTLVLALAVMFLLILLGSLFVTLIARNVELSARGGRVTAAESLGLAGLDYVKNQLSTSVDAADWRPVPTGLWASPTANMALKQRDPDYFWLSDDGNFRRPYVRVPARGGRFLVRLTYEPHFVRGRQASTAPDRFDVNSMFIHVEVVGRPGEVDETDPTTLRDPNNPNFRPGQIVGEYRKYDAWVPIGLMDQLWWITNSEGQSSPARLGVPPYVDGNNNLVQYTSDFFGSIRANTSVEWVGRNNVHLYAPRGEMVAINGDSLLGRSGDVNASLTVFLKNPGNSTGAPQDNQDDNPADDGVIATGLQGSSGTPAFSTWRDPDGPPHFVDNRRYNDLGQDLAQVTRSAPGPLLRQKDPNTGVARYLGLTRDNGDWGTVTGAGETRRVNLAWYGYGRGLYFDNFQDVQYPEDRTAVVDEWMRRGSTDVNNTSWTGNRYIPSVREAGTTHPILELVFTPTGGIIATRFDRDVRHMNFGTAVGQTRIFYNYDNDPNSPTYRQMLPAGPTWEFAYPENGIILCEGSVRVRGVIPAGRQLILLSRGSVYLEGNLLRGDANSHLGIFAQDYVCLNPTNLFRVTLGTDVTTTGEPLGPEGQLGGQYWSIPQNSDLDMRWTLGQNLDPATHRFLLHVKHSAQAEDSTSVTDISLYLNDYSQAYPFGRYDLRAGYPPTAGMSNDTRYHFLFFPPNVPGAWNQSRFQSTPGGSPNWERKSFWIPSGFNTGRGQDNSFRFHVEPQENGQPYWLGECGVSLVRDNGAPEPMQVTIQAVLYAENHSWFVIPARWFNDDPNDSRIAYTSRNGERAPGVDPPGNSHYPFYREPLNLEITVEGSITENMPSEVVDRAQWTNTLWLAGDQYRANGVPVDPGFRPNLRFVYNHDYRRYVRYQEVPNGPSGIAYVGPVDNMGAPVVPANAPTLAAVRQAALSRDHYVVTMPLLPKLPVGPVIYQGSPR